MGILTGKVVSISASVLKAERKGSLWSVTMKEAFVAQVSTSMRKGGNFMGERGSEQINLPAYNEGFCGILIFIEIFFWKFNHLPILHDQTHTHTHNVYPLLGAGYQIYSRKS